MEAGVPNLAIPQDNILFASLYREVVATKIPYFLSGGNFALECILQRGNTHGSMDLTNLGDIQKKFGTEPIDKLHFISSTKNIWWRRRGDWKNCVSSTILITIEIGLFMNCPTSVDLNITGENTWRIFWRRLSNFIGFLENLRRTSGHLIYPVWLYPARWPGNKRWRS